MEPATSSSTSSGGRRAARTSVSSASGGGGGGGGDSVSAALLWKLRANAESGADTAATAPAAPNPAAFLPMSVGSSSSSATGARRGPGRPRKADANAKSAAKWDDTVTAQLLQFRYVDMRSAFEGVRNNVEVGECWIHLASEISRLSGKSFDSHQCQSKLRNLKKNWRELSKSSKSASTSPLYAMLGQYLSSGASAAAAAGSHDNADTSSGEQGEPRASSFGVSHILRRSGSVSSADEDDGNERGDENPGLDAEDGDGDEEVRGESSRRETGAEDGADPAEGGEVDSGEATAATEQHAGGTRPRSDSSTSSACSSETRSPKRQKQDGSSTARTVDADADDAVAPGLRNIVESHSERIDASLLSVAGGLRTMMEGVIAAKDESSEQTIILAELREHNLLMKRYCEEVSKQTVSLNSLIELLTAKFGADGGKGHAYAHAPDKAAPMSKAALDHRAKQLNPNNPLYESNRHGKNEE